MKNMDILLDKYAQLVVRTGVNLQKDQLLVVSAPIECADFARRIAREAYAAGGRDVKVLWGDEKLARIRLDMGATEIFGEFPQWRQDMYNDYQAKGAAFISIHAADPEIFKGVDQNKLLLSQRAAGVALARYRAAMMNNENCWCVVSIPTKAWAAKVFADAKDAGAAVEQLWQAIFSAVRISENNDPVADWNAHIAFLKKACDFLNGHQFTALHYTNSLGTDLTVKLPKGHIWCGGAEVATNANKTVFVANMPTEEVYTASDKDGVDGVVYSTKPLNYHGSLIEGMRLEFQAGKVVKATATAGQEVLDQLLATDEGATHLGEAALVPYDSPISNSGILFYNTLFDENAACHLAFGKAYPTCIEDGESQTIEELAQRGVNDSLVHEDFMVGSADMDIVGIRADGTQVQVFRNGNFVEF